MKRYRWVWATLALAAVFVTVVLRLFGIEFSTGQTYPEYSTLRADLRGAKLLYNSLAGISGLNVTRNFLPLNTLTSEAATLVLLACDPGDSLDVIDKLATGGERIVIALPDDFNPSAPERFALRHLGLRFEKVDATKDRDAHWQLSEAQGWTVIDRDGGQLNAVEKNSGKGSLVVFADSNAFSDNSTVDEQTEELTPIAKAIGVNSRVIFDESHLGVTESGSVIGLARRFRLTGLAFGFALLAALFIWRNATSFPPARERAQRGAARSATQGLETLLRRHVSVASLAENCWREWLASNRREFPETKITRARAEIANLAKTPLAAARSVHQVLYSKGEL